MSSPDAIALARALRAREHAPRAQLVALQQQRLDALVAHARERSPYYRRTLARAARPRRARVAPDAGQGDPDRALRRASPATRGCGATRCARISPVPMPHEPYLRRVTGCCAPAARAAAPACSSTTRPAGPPTWRSSCASPRSRACALWEQPGVRVGVVVGDRSHARERPGRDDVRRARPRAPARRSRSRSRSRGSSTGLNDDATRRAARLRLLRRAARRRAVGRAGCASRRASSPAAASCSPPTWLAASRPRSACAPFDFYATTEGLWAAQCAAHAGFHVFGELCHRRERRRRRTARPRRDARRSRAGHQPLQPRPAAHPLRAPRRRDPSTPSPVPAGARSRASGTCTAAAPTSSCSTASPVHPLQFAALAADPDVREFQVVQHGNRLTLRVVCADDADRAAPRRAAHPARRRRAARARGRPDPQIAIEPCRAIDRPASGKLPLVVAEPAPQVVAQAGAGVGDQRVDARSPPGR